MNELLQHLPTHRIEPRLWVERLEIFREPHPDQRIPPITLRRGLNVIWAREPDKDSPHAGLHAAGHGVGKTSFCLLLRYCLGDRSKSIDELKAELILEFPQGGVGAVVHVEGKVYTVFRYFNAYREGMAEQGDDVVSLLLNGGSLTYREFEALLSGAMLSAITPRNIPETGQLIEWRHVLAWMARDQAARLKEFFNWREDKGAGLKRSRKDPPIVFRALLGLVEERESKLLTRLRSLKKYLETAQAAHTSLLQEPSLIRQRIDSEVRIWLNAPHDLPRYSNDLFKTSVEQEIIKKQIKAKASLDQLESEITVLEEDLFQARLEHQQVKSVSDTAQIDYEKADAARQGDEAAYRKLTEKREKLRGLFDICDHGQVFFQDCHHIKNEIETVSFLGGREQNALYKNVEYWTERTKQALTRQDELKKLLKSAFGKATAKEKAIKDCKLRRDTSLLEWSRGQGLLEELARWKENLGSPETAKKVYKVAKLCTSIQQKIDSAHTRLSVVQHESSARKRALGELTNFLAQELLSKDAYGAMDVRNKSRPFRLSLRGGQAFRVLEILLGDLVCLLDASSSASAFPGLLIHDCPREADMGPHPYGDFLSLIERIQTQAYKDGVPFQYIVTTTTPPPESLQKFPYLRLTLDPSKEDGLLFKKRFNSQSQSQAGL